MKMKNKMNCGSHFTMRYKDTVCGTVEVSAMASTCEIIIQNNQAVQLKINGVVYKKGQFEVDIKQNDIIEITLLMDKKIPT